MWSIERMTPDLPVKSVREITFNNPQEGSWMKKLSGEFLILELEGHSGDGPDWCMGTTNHIMYLVDSKSGIFESDRDKLFCFMNKIWRYTRTSRDIDGNESDVYTFHDTEYKNATFVPFKLNDPVKNVWLGATDR
jgi:hypothetical protein